MSLLEELGPALGLSNFSPGSTTSSTLRGSLGGWSASISKESEEVRVVDGSRWGGGWNVASPKFNTPGRGKLRRHSAAVVGELER